MHGGVTGTAGDRLPMSIRVDGERHMNSLTPVHSTGHESNRQEQISAMSLESSGGLGCT